MIDVNFKHRTPGGYPTEASDGTVRYLDRVSECGVVGRDSATEGEDNQVNSESGGVGGGFLSNVTSIRSSFISMERRVPHSICSPLRGI